MGHYQKALKENRTDSQMKCYKAVARPSLLYGSQTWVTTERDMTGLEAAELRFLRSVTGYTRLDKIGSEVIRKKLEISGIQDVRLKYKQNWINHFERFILLLLLLLLLSSHQSLGLPNGFFSSGFPTKILHTPLLSPVRAIWSARHNLLDLVTRIMSLSTVRLHYVLRFLVAH